MTAIRVLVVDDSVVVRKMVTDILSETEGIEVAGTASNGKIGLDKVEKLKPDLVTLDIEMPVMGGLEALPQMLEIQPKLPVVMFSATTERGATSTLDALALGARDYVTKPSKSSSPEASIESVRASLVPKIKALCHEKASEQALAAAPKPAQRAAPTPVVTPRRIDLVAIGISTGGPNALAEMLPHLPADLDVPMVVVQHMPPVFTGYLAKRLDAECKLRVREGEAGTVLEPGTCWIAPGGLHMTVERSGASLVLELNEAPPENHCRPAVDVLFRSVAASLGARSLSVVMTGMGQDGLIGCEAAKERGGQVIVQDEASSVIWGMPGFVAKAGLAEEILPLSEIASAIGERVAFGRTRQRG